MKRKKDKKGQITIFIIIGIVLVLGTALYLILSERLTRPYADIEIGETPLNIIMENCLEKTAEQGILFIGTQGGYYNLTEEYIVTDYSSVPYYLQKEKEEIPSKEKIASEIARYIEDNIFYCIGNFSEIEKEGFTLVEAPPSADVMIDDYAVQVDLDLPIKIIKDNAEIELPKFSKTISSSIGKIHDLAVKIIDMEKQDPGWIDLSSISNTEFKVDIIPETEEDMIYIIKDNQQIDGQDNFSLLFATSQEKNNPPIIKGIARAGLTVRLKDAQDYNLQVEAADPDNDKITFYDDTAMFDITETGTISFTPDVTGEFEVLITVEDEHGARESQIITFIVEE